MTVTARCNRCRRPLRDPVWVVVGLGPVCAARLGLVRIRPPLAPAPPRAAAAVQQPSLLDLVDATEGENDMGQSERDTGEETAVAECRCPRGYPVTHFTTAVPDGRREIIRRHHINLCGLPDEHIGER